jgi:hypothetical protein
MKSCLSHDAQLPIAFLNESKQHYQEIKNLVQQNTDSFKKEYNDIAAKLQSAKTQFMTMWSLIVGGIFFIIFGFTSSSITLGGVGLFAAIIGFSWRHFRNPAFIKAQLTEVHNNQMQIAHQIGVKL